MNDNPLISVIVPVYNVEKWLLRCIKSICEQTYTNLQIILVDDGSLDKSGDLCDQLADKDKRIMVIHQKNGGLSYARNTGMEHIQGDFVCFVDSDDWLEKYYIENLFLAISQNQADVAGCEYRKCIEGQNYSKTDHTFNIREFSCIAAMSELIDNKIQQVVWNKLYRADMVDGIFFEKGKYHEDEFWSYQVFAKIRKYVAISYVGYNYFQRADSIMGEKYSLKRLDAVEAKCHRQAFLEVEMPELALNGRLNLRFTCLYHGQLAWIYLEKQKRTEVFRYLKIIIKKYPVGIMNNREVSVKQKIWIVLTEFSFTFTCWLRNTLKIGF